MRRTKEAFHWIIKLLRKHRIPFQLTGGLAAELYGSQRPLADIDIDIPKNKFKSLVPEVKEYIVFGPARYKDKHWNLRLMTLKYNNQVIDICSSHKKIFDHFKKKWVEIDTHFHKSKMLYVFGLRVPTIAEGEFIAYKKELWRKVDKIDVEEMS